MLDRLTSLEVSGKVASTGSFSAAGRAMGISQTMVKKHVAVLEARLGVKLFHRSTRRLSITEAGRSYPAFIVAHIAPEPSWDGQHQTPGRSTRSKP